VSVLAARRTWGRGGGVDGVQSRLAQWRGEGPGVSRFPVSPGGDDFTGAIVEPALDQQLTRPPGPEEAEDAGPVVRRAPPARLHVADGDAPARVTEEDVATVRADRVEGGTQPARPGRGERSRPVPHAVR